MKWTENQKEVIDSRNCNLLVSAAAGSGKTAVLVERIIQMIADKNNPIDIDQLLVVTFTKAAAAQMKDKIAKAVEKMLMEDPENNHYLNQMNYIQKANILTIDSFCYQVVKENFHILGIDPGIRIGEAGEIGLLKEEVLEDVIEEAYKNNKDFVAFSDSFSSDKNDDKMETYILDIYRVCSSYPCPEEWIQSAKKALNIKSEEEFLKLTFVKEYFNEVHNLAKDMKNKISNLLELARDIDGPHYMEKGLRSDQEIIDNMIAAHTYTQFSDLADYKFTMIREKKGEVYNEEIKEYILEVRDKYKDAIKKILENFKLPFKVVLSQFNNQEARLNALLEITENFRIKFLKAKLEKNILEFSDVEHFALQILCEGYDEEGNPIPSNIGRELSENFKEILIDEYQDSNYLQEAILKSVSKISQGMNNIFMVGDVKQSIYSFRMARPDLFMEKYDTYDLEEGKDCRKILLKNNFRSRTNILNSINYIFYQIMKRDIGGIEYTEDEALVPGRKFPEIDNDSVELLIGEGKDFEYLEKKEEATAFSNQKLDENLQDIGKQELEAKIVSKKIKKLLGKNGEQPFQIVDDKTGKLRDVSYKDIVILFRSHTSFQQIFLEVLTNDGIPVKAQNEKGYFDTVEIRLLLSLLRIIDNPYNDVELVAVLRSYFCRLSSDELSLIAMLKRYLQEKGKPQLYIYSVIKELAYLTNTDADTDFLETILDKNLIEYKECIKNKVSVKCKEFLIFIQKMQEMKSYMSIDQILTEIYYNKGYYFYVRVMPDGEQRVRNLDLFLDETKKFQVGPFQSIFDFLTYVDKLLKKSIELGGDPSPETSEDVVRIMSIHKSKGLEFPVVFLSGMGKKFNLQDTKAPLIIHSDYYLAAKYRDPIERSGNETFARKAFSALMSTQSIAEELRILYVGLTRAKEKLIMTGVTSDIPALIKKHNNLGKNKEIKLSYSVIHSFDNYLDMIIAALIRNQIFYEAMKNVRKRIDQKTNKIISAEYNEPYYINQPEINLQVEVYDFKELTNQHIWSAIENLSDKQEMLEKLMNAPTNNIEKMKQNLAWKYADCDLVEQKSKMAVTEIKRIYEEKDENLIENTCEKGNYVPPVPSFIAQKKEMNAAEKGMWLHKVMELLDFKKISSQEDVEDILNIMWNEERLPKETETFIKADKIFAFMNSALGKRMRKAAEIGNLFKEKQFIVGVPTEKILKNQKSYTSNSSVLVQGIIDAYFKEDDHLILLDYKTDFIKHGQEQILMDRYKTQLLYYKDTLEQLTGLTVTETYLYTFALDKEIRLF